MAGRHRSPARKGFRRVVGWTLLAFAAVVIALTAQTVFAAFWVSRDAETLQAQVEVARVAVAEGRFADAATAAEQITTTATGLRDQTEESTWWRAQQLPLVGTSFEAVHVLSRATADVATAAQPVFTRLQGVTGTSAGLVALSGSADDIRALEGVVASAEKSVAALPTGGLFLGVDQAVQRAQESLPELADTVAQAAQFADLLPGIVGTQAPVRWLVMLQNPAESRGSGGNFSAYAIIEFSEGKPRIVEASSRRSGLDGTRIPYAQATDADTIALWGSDIADWASFNLSADFPTVARLASAGMAARGTPVDGVIAIDPAAVGALLAGTGPVEHKGVTIDSASAANFFTKDIYQSFPDFPDVAAKDDLSMGLLYATADSVINRPLAVHELWTALKTAVDAGHVKAWSADAKVEDWLMSLPLGGQISRQRGPSIALALNNATGGKIDAYVTGRVDYQVAQCLVKSDESSSPPMARSTVTIDLDNRAPQGLPPYVDVRLDDPTAPAGSTKAYLALYGPVDSVLSDVTLDGVPLYPTKLKEAGRPVWAVPIELGRGQHRTLTYLLNEPLAPDATPSVAIAPTGGGLATSAVDVGSPTACR
jgi:hypothetical protein